MFRTFNDETLSALLKPHRDDPLVELWQLVVDRTPLWTPTLCITNQPEPVTFGGITFWPFPAERSEIEWDDEGSLPRCLLRISNVNRTVARWVEEGNGFVEQPATLWVGLHSQVNQAGGMIGVGFSVAQAALDDELLQLEMQARGVLPLDIPAERFQRTRCAWRFRSQECGYEPDPAFGANYRTCNKTLDDCVLRGQDEVNRGLPRLHPTQFGAFPGLPRL